MSGSKDKNEVWGAAQYLIARAGFLLFWISTETLRDGVSNAVSVNVCFFFIGSSGVTALSDWSALADFLFGVHRNPCAACQGRLATSIPRAVERARWRGLTKATTCSTCLAAR
jgi:hypothetical protein